MVQSWIVFIEYDKKLWNVISNGRDLLVHVHELLVIIRAMVAMIDHGGKNVCTFRLN